MRRDLKILIGAVVAGGTLLGMEHGSEWLAGLSTFHVQDVDVAGATFVAPEEVVRLMALQPTSSIWEEKSVWAERIERHPMIRTVEVARRFPAGLRVTITERQPVALAPTPTLEPVDADGYRLPVDPSHHRLDLPVLSTRLTPARGARLVPEAVRDLAGEVGRMMSADTAFMQMVSSVRWGDDETLVARWTEPSVDFLLPRRASPARLREGLGALANAISRTPANPPHAIDLRFADQVVVRRASIDRRVAMLSRSPREED